MTLNDIIQHVEFSILKFKDLNLRHLDYISNALHIKRQKLQKLWLRKTS